MVSLVVLTSVAEETQTIPPSFQGNYAEAEPLYVRALEIREKILGADHHDLATTLNDLALLLNAQVRALDFPRSRMPCGMRAY